MKRILFSPINTNFMNARYQTFVHTLLESFEIITDQKHVKDAFNHKNLRLIEINPPIDDQVIQQNLKNEFDQIHQLILDISTHFSGENIHDIFGDHLNRSVKQSVNSYVRTDYIMQQNDIDFLILSPNIEDFLLPLCEKYKIKSLYLEHAPNISFNYFSTISNFLTLTNQENNYPDYVISDHSFSTSQWNSVFKKSKNTKTKILEFGIPLDTTAKPSQNLEKAPDTTTIGIYGTWIELKNINSPIYNQILIGDVYIKLFDILSDLSDLFNLNIIIKNHPAIEYNKRQTQPFFTNLAKESKLNDIKITTDLTESIINTDIAICLSKTSILTDLMIADVPSIIFDSLNFNYKNIIPSEIQNIIKVCDNFDDLKEITLKYLNYNKRKDFKKEIQKFKFDHNISWSTPKENSERISNFLSEFT